MFDEAKAGQRNLEKQLSPSERVGINCGRRSKWNRSVGYRYRDYGPS